MQLQIDFLLYQSIPQTPPEADHTLNHTVMFFLGFIITEILLLLPVGRPYISGNLVYHHTFIYEKFTAYRILK